LLKIQFFAKLSYYVTSVLAFHQGMAFDDAGVIQGGHQLGLLVKQAL